VSRPGARTRKPVDRTRNSDRLVRSRRGSAPPARRFSRRTKRRCHLGNKAPARAPHAEHAPSPGATNLERPTDPL